MVFRTLERRTDEENDHEVDVLVDTDEDVQAAIEATSIEHVD